MPDVFRRHRWLLPLIVLLGIGGFALAYVTTHEELVVSGRLPPGSYAYVSLHPGQPRYIAEVRTLAEQNLDSSESLFALRANIDSKVAKHMFIYASAQGLFADSCVYIELPSLKRDGDRWVVADTGRPLDLWIDFEETDLDIGCD